MDIEPLEERRLKGFFFFRKPRWALNAVAHHAWRTRQTDFA